MFGFLTVLFLVSEIKGFPMMWKECKFLEMSHDLSNETMIAPLTVYIENSFKLHTMNDGMAKSSGDGKSFYFHYNKFSAIEHISTHMDAPKHLLRTLKEAQTARTIDQVPLTSLVGEACVLDVPEEQKDNKDYLISIDDVKKWEEKHGKLHEDCMVFIRSGQGKYWGDSKKYFGSDTPGHVDPDTGWPDTMHWPGLDWRAAKWILDNRGLKAIGQDAVSFDAGALRDYSESVHTVILGANKPGFENLKNLDKLPPRGATIIALPMLIKHGSGAPTRIMAVGWNGPDDPCRVTSSAEGFGINLAMIFVTIFICFYKS